MCSFCFLSFPGSESSSGFSSSCLSSVFERFSSHFVALSSTFSTSLISANFVFFVESFFDMFFLFKGKYILFLLIF